MFVCHMPDETIEDVYGFMEKIHEIDVNAYDSEDAGEIMPMVERYPSNPESYIYVWDTERERIAGYINFFPVNNLLEAMIKSPDTPYAMLDDGISPEQIMPFIPGREHFIYILSIAIRGEVPEENDPGYRKSEVIKLLTDGFVSFLRSKYINDGCLIKAIAGCVVSEGGKRVMKSLRAEMLHKVSGTEKDKAIYICDNSASDKVVHAGDLNKLLYLGVDVPSAYSSEFPRECFAIDNSDDDEDDDDFNAQSENDGQDESIEYVDDYVKTWKDDIYLYLPMTEHVANLRTDIFFDREKDDFSPIDTDQANNAPDRQEEKAVDNKIAKKILSQLSEMIEYECSSQSIKDMRIHYLGCYEFLHTTDQYPCRDRKYDPLHDEEHYTALVHTESLTQHDIENRIRNELLYTYDNAPCSSADAGSEASGNKETDEKPVRRDNEEIVVGLRKGYVFITSHRPTHMYVINVFFPNYPYSSTQLEDQVSNNYLKIVDPRYKGGSRRFVRLYDYLWEKYLLHKCGQEKIMLCMSGRPDENVYKTEFENVLSAEVYHSLFQTFHIGSDKLKELSGVNHAQYDYYSAYLSNKVIAFIPNDFGYDNFGDSLDDIGARVKLTSTYSFIAELIMFQNTALARMNMKVSDLLYKNDKVTMDDVMNLEQEYGKTIPFWEPSNFKYMGTALEASCIKEAFSNDELLETYNKHQDYLENIVDLMSSDRENRNSMILNVAATILAVIQVESFLTGMLERFYADVGITIAKEYLGFERTFGNTLIGGLTFIVIYLVVVNYRKKKERRLRERYKKQR